MLSIIAVLGVLPVFGGSASAEVSESVWYPSAVPSMESSRWKVAIGSYVRGRDVYPLSSGLAVAENVACAQARKVRQGVVVLSFGRQKAGGSSGFGTWLSYTTIARVAAAWAKGLARCGTGRWEVAIGTSNSGGVTDYNGYFGGARWARAVAKARKLSDQRVRISGAVDLEPGWGPARQARAWVNGFVKTSSARLWNFGSADGCPQSVSSDVTCGFGWSMDDVLWVSSGAGRNVVAMPQIHTVRGSQARQWAVLASRAVRRGVALRLGAITVQTAACAQVSEGCGHTGLSAWDAWTQLRTLLDMRASTRDMPLGAPMDIRWGWSRYVFTPPPTTTTSTTTTTTSTTTTSTTTTTIDESTSTTTESTAPSTG